MTLILGIETSCDETGAAVVEDGVHMRSNVVASQIDLHAQYGGVFPEVASRAHIEAIAPIVEQGLADAGVTLTDLDAIAVTRGPGLAGSLLVGVNFAKGLALATGLPLVGVNHLEGHVYSLWLAGRESPVRFPVVCLIVSGGHSEIVLISDHGQYRQLGTTLDDAAGEAFDKVARVLGIPYPGGPLLDRLAEEGDDGRYRFPHPRTDGPYDFSFSGLKTAVVNRAHNLRQLGEEIVPADFAASFRRAVVDMLVEKSVRAAADLGVKRLAAAGGVAANRLLRRELARRGEAAGLEVFLPPVELCTDNAAMIASAAYYRLLDGEVAGLGLNALPSIRMFD